MSGLGQSRRIRESAYAASTPTADTSEHGWHFAFGPGTDIWTLALVSPRTEQLGCLQEIGAAVRRREIVGLLGGAGIWPLTAGAQQKNLPLIGALLVGFNGPQEDTRGWSGTF
jgi:hypothetical protein